MNRVFAFLLLFAIGYVSAQTNETLCDINFLRSLESSNTTSSLGDNLTGDFVCSTSDESLSLAPKNDTIPASKNTVPGNTVDIPPLDPSLILIWEKDQLNGVFNSSKNNGSTVFELLVALAPGETNTSSVMADISYDFNGDAQIDRLEVYEKFNVTGGSNTTSFVSYEGSATTLKETEGFEFRNFTNGSIRLRVWSPFGGSLLLIKTGGKETTGNDTSTNATATNETSTTSTIGFPYNWGNETTGTGGAGGGTGGGAECCDEISSLQSELDAMKTQLDSLSARLLNVTRNCCSNTTATATASQTVVETVTASASTPGTA